MRDVCQRWGTAWNDHDGNAVAALCSEDLVYDEPALGDTVHGRDAIRDFVVMLDVSFPDHKFFLEEDGLIGAYRCLYDNDLVLRQLGENRSQ
ncbi:nuclear transport factor 2 family protein [Mycobacterium sp.]|uniref:nuclear transport factor 2 family protein n=1 Tax=Mycobacterium sp. TaxID=1785 RepID=UPI003C77F7AC